MTENLMTNQEIAKILYEMAAYYEMQDVAFKPRAYEKAAQAIEALDTQVADIYKDKGLKGFFEIPGIGKGIADHLEELVRSGRLKHYVELKKKIPVNLSELMSISGIGPKTIKVLYQKLKIKNLTDLQRAAEAHQIAKLSGFGQRSEKKILEGLKFREQSGSRYVLGFIAPLVAELVRRLEGSKLFSRLMVGGSYRRRQETVGDIDILGIAKNPRKAMDFFVNLQDVEQVLQHGEDKSEIRLDNGLQVDLRLIESGSWGAASQYFTGDKSHNVKLRKIAIAKGLKLSEYGVFRGRKLVAGKTEEEVYRKLGMDWIPPELRTDTGEIEAALEHKLPKILEYGSVRGDLQVQTDWTDGQDSIEEMARAALKLGREYIAITDHTKSLAMTGGLDEQELLRQGKEIDKVNAKLTHSTSSGQNSFRILKGAEVNILKDGSLDIADDVLAKLDVVGVAVHSHFNLPRAEMTKRITRAFRNQNVDIFFHPTTRIINKRPPIDFDYAGILKVAKKNRVALEIDAYPDRLDIHDTLIRQAVEAGVKLVIDSDAHSTGHLDLIKWGEAQARRGWATKNDVLNTKPVDEFMKYFNK